MMDSILTVREMARFLKMNERTVLRMAQASVIPAAKIGNQWRFKRELIDRWLDERMLPASDKQSLGPVHCTPRFPPLTEMVDKRLVKLELEASDKKEILAQLVDLLVAAHHLRRGDDFLHRLMKRENLMTTALGDGVAFPHARNPQDCPFDAPMLVVGVSRCGVDYDALDGKPVHILFLICASDDSTHLRIMAQLTRVVRTMDVVRLLLETKSNEEVVDLFREWDRHLASLPGFTT
jgi:PTS system nitrogen regulatory IIA component